VTRQPIDYDGLGFMVGMEIHQQLLTSQKLFCHCPAGIYTKEHDGEVLRHMRPTLSEMGTYDGTALMEFKTRKDIIYLLHRDNVCTYEMDDTPPFLVNQEAIDIAIQISLALHCKIVDEIHIARKQYLDGSIPTGFQRTAIIGVEGWVPFRGRKIGIRQISVEEDSCREVSDIGHTVTFRTDRLGMPLIEVVTEPDMKTPEEAAAVVELIGRLMRSTQRVRRGIGASRQDVNVSIRGGRRVEIKGVPRFPLIPDLVHWEAVRQKALLEIREEIAARGITPDTLRSVKADLTKMARNGKPPFIPEDVEAVGAIRLEGLAGILTREVGPHRTFATEVAGRLRVIACLDQLPNLVHTDAWPEYLNSGVHAQDVRKRMGATMEDVVVVVWGDALDVKTALEEVKLRVIDAMDGVPNETRQVMADGTTDFERILPGPDRMYPDTDSPPTRVLAERVEHLRTLLTTPPWELEERFEAAGIPRPAALRLAIHRHARILEALEVDGVDLRMAGRLLGETLVGLRRAGVKVDNIDDADLLEVLRLHASGEVLRECLARLVRRLARGGELTEVLAEPHFQPLPAAELEARVLAALPEDPEDLIETRDPEARFRAAMGIVMNQVRGQLRGRDVAPLVREALAL
jgi:glutamyl-tRNA(Gln) amidotransferase subunit E